MIFEGVLLLLLQAPAAQAPSVPAAYCTSERAAVRRAWSIYMAKNSISEDEMVANGSKIMGLSMMMTPCGGNSSVDTTALSNKEIDDFRSFRPEGEFVAWARCLTQSAPDKALAYLEASDRMALKKYAQTRQIGGHDDQTFVELISTDACADEFVDNVKAQQFYEDINWFARVAPRAETIADWHEGSGNA